jgi:hypothetical protein
MPYPPRPPRKHPELPPSEARSGHLQAYQFRPGRSGNPSGMSNSQRELYLEARDLAHRLGPGAIRRLGELAGIPMDPAKPWVPLEQLEIDPRVVYMASVALCERAYGKPREYDPEQAMGRDQLAARLEAARQRTVGEVGEPATALQAVGEGNGAADRD